MSTLDLNIKKGHIASLIKLAKADGIVTQSEVNLIKLIAVRMGITSSEFNEVVINLEHITALPPTSIEQKERYLYEIFQLMKVDLSTGEEEQKICEELGLRLGFGVSEVKKVAEFMSTRLDQIISFDEFKNELNQ